MVGGGGEVEMVWEVLLCGCKSALGVSVFGGWVRGMGRVCFAVLKSGLCNQRAEKVMYISLVWSRNIWNGFL